MARDIDIRLIELANRAVEAAPELKDAIHRVTMDALFPSRGDACERCKGTGTIWRGYPPRITCPSCKGTGGRGPTRS